ncbi:hypothetical protein K4L06_22105 [Lysobacter sp. BMK333-48F3]|uniref:hypothetical protein n=1 Tax=Lysobacter sp. BMK333-48F3 TaxID=2867962 RepID=UPI001C8B5B1C|nr:hypothetical protein [Lysobacter sp. BMK333-48F3]MBX9404000.1 hypothetical protein [Lysobacter sp. BMK333-48F3]
MGVYIVASIAWLVAIESTLNGGFYESVAWLWLPLLAIVAAYAWCYRHWLTQRLRRRWKVVGYAAMTCGLLLLMSWPYWMAANALVDRGEMVLHGPLTKKYIAGARYRANALEFRDLATGQIASVPVSPQLYHAASPGAQVRCVFRRGWFGIAYRWRKSSIGPPCTIQPQRNGPPN